MAPVQLLLTLPSRDVSVEVLCGLGRIANVLLMLVQEVEARLLRHLLHVAQALVLHSRIILGSWKETLHNLSSLR